MQTEEFYNPAQKRDKDGKWTTGGSSGSEGFNPPNGANPDLAANGYMALDAQRMESQPPGYIPAYGSSKPVKTDLQKVYEHNMKVVGERWRKDIGDDPEVRIRVTAGVLDKVLADGGFRTQHDTGRSNGMFDPHARDRWERKMFAVDLPRPVYGYVQGNVKQSSVSVIHYGDIAVVLKKDIRDRTTVTAGDSLYEHLGIAPVPLNNVQKVSNERLAVATTQHNPAAEVGWGERNIDRVRPSYYEAQIHGPVRVSDIAKVVGTVDTLSKLKPFLDDAGIEVEYLPDGQDIEYISQYSANEDPVQSDFFHTSSVVADGYFVRT